MWWKYGPVTVLARGSVLPSSDHSGSRRLVPCLGGDKFGDGASERGRAELGGP